MRILSGIIMSISLLFSASAIYSQISLHWVSRYNGTENFRDEGRAVATDIAGNIYVTGFSFNTGSFEDITTVKYNTSGVQIWAAVYNGSGNGNDRASSIYPDNSGNIYVSGYASGAASSSDFVTIKYNTNGIQQWISTYNGTGNAIDYVNSMSVDQNGNVYVTGQSYGGVVTQYDYATVKYNSDGVQQWVTRYNGSGNSNDQSASVATDVSGNVYVTGSSFESSTSTLDYATIKYNSSGIQQWISYYNGPGNGIDGASSVKADNPGNVYVTGYSRGLGSQYDFATIKYNSSGEQQWVSRHNGNANGNDGANFMIVDTDGNVFVSGYSPMTGLTNDIVLIKYDNAGIRQWISFYNGPANQSDSSLAMAMDSQGNICVTGFSNGSGTSKDFITILYSGNGIQQWAMRYDSENNNEDIAYSAAFDQLGNVYVAGKSPTENTAEDIVTLKYSTLSGVSNVISGASWNFELYGNYPNPFNPSTKISFTIPELSLVRLSVYDVLGNKVAILADERLAPGNYTKEFNPVNLPGGVYFCKLEAGNFTKTRKMILVK